MVSKRVLLAIASFVWLSAGFNVARIGIAEYADNFTPLLPLWTVLVFIPFFFMFRQMVKKNTRRILAYESERVLFLKFFTLKSYILIAVMMSLGMVLRGVSAVPRMFIAFFYTGLGCALFLAGVHFAVLCIAFSRTMRKYGPSSKCTE